MKISCYNKDYYLFEQVTKDTVCSNVLCFLFYMPSKKVKNIRGEQFGDLIVIEFSHCTDKGDAYWRCICKCGNEKTILGAALRRKATLSCGCFQKEKAKEHLRALAKKRITHGMGQTRFYNTWYHMVERCTIRGRKDNKNYIDRGITVETQWLDFNCFMKDMYVPYLEHCKIYGERETELDRINNNAGYSRLNCRWATKIQQARNKRTNTFIEWQGERYCIAEWSERTGICQYAISKRLRRGWTVGKALTTPVRAV